jgi:hypothetical protein
MFRGFSFFPWRISQYILWKIHLSSWFVTYVLCRWHAFSWKIMFCMLYIGFGYQVKYRGYGNWNFQPPLVNEFIMQKSQLIKYGLSLSWFDLLVQPKPHACVCSSFRCNSVLQLICPKLLVLPSLKIILKMFSCYHFWNSNFVLKTHMVFDR